MSVTTNNSTRNESSNAYLTNTSVIKNVETFNCHMKVRALQEQNTEYFY
jgi:hypothetical protein